MVLLTEVEFPATAPDPEARGRKLPFPPPLLLHAVAKPQPRRLTSESAFPTSSQASWRSFVAGSTMVLLTEVELRATAPNPEARGRKPFVSAPGRLACHCPKPKPAGGNPCFRPLLPLAAFDVEVVVPPPAAASCGCKPPPRPLTSRARAPVCPSFDLMKLYLS